MKARIDLRHLISILRAIFEEMVAIEIKGCPSAKYFKTSDDRCFSSTFKWKLVGSDVKKNL